MKNYKKETEDFGPIDDYVCKTIGKKDQFKQLSAEEYFKQQEEPKHRLLAEDFFGSFSDIACSGTIPEVPLYYDLGDTSNDR